MKKNVVLARTAAGVVGGLLLIGGAGAAFAAEDNAVGNQEVGVDVQIDAVGALTLSVASGSTSLTEVPSGDAGIRQFNGALPDVTVTDDRQSVPEGVFWYVTGQSSALRDGTNSIDAGHLGWAPKLITDTGDGEVGEGAQVNTVLDAPTPNVPADNVGLVGNELLALSLDSQSAASVGSWTAGADLFLKVPSTVTPGAYAGTITLTLWEDQVD